MNVMTCKPVTAGKMAAQINGLSGLLGQIDEQINRIKDQAASTSVAA
jgi:hypothetical protein